MDRKAFSISTAICLTSLACLLFAAQVSAYIYWGDVQNHRIGRAENDGSGVNPNFIHTAGAPIGVAVDSGHVYWASEDGNTIGRANIDGTGVDDNFITGVSKPDSVAVNGTSIYWATLPGPIGRANLDGSNVNKNFVTQAIQPCGIALDSGHLYWADEVLAEARIGRASLDGFAVEPEFVNIGAAFPCGVAVNSASIFWADLGFIGPGTRIGRADKTTGKGVDVSFISGAAAPCGITLDTSSRLYWANAETNTIARANTDGTEVNESFIATGGFQICGVAVDTLSTPPPSPPSGGGSSGGGTGGGGGGSTPDTTPPTTTITKGPGNKLAQAKAKFAFRANEPNSTFTCKLDKQKPKPCVSPKTYKGLKPGRHTFKVWATDAAGNKAMAPAKRTFKVPA